MDQIKTETLNMMNLKNLICLFLLVLPLRVAAEEVVTNAVYDESELETLDESRIMRTGALPLTPLEGLNGEQESFLRQCIEHSKSQNLRISEKMIYITCRNRALTI